MDFYANENFHLDMVEALRGLGHQVLTSQEAGQANKGIPDDLVLDFASQRSLIVITFNRDDFIALNREGREHSGIIVCKEHRDYGGQMSVLHLFLQQQSSLNGRLLRVKMRQQPGTSKPTFVVDEYDR